MNWIPCDQKCRHQQDGYCALNHITQLAANASRTCGYYEALPKARRAADISPIKDRRPEH